MKTLFKLLLILISTSCFSQILVEKSIGGELDVSTQQFKIEINEEVISGILTETKVKDLRFYTIENNDKILVLRFGKDIESVNTDMDLIQRKSLLISTKIFDIYYLQESFKMIKKTIKKNQFEGLKSLNLLFSSNDFGDVWKDKKEVEEKEREKEYDEKTELENYIGVYKIKITKTGSHKINYDSFGKLFVSELGITIETEIPSISLIRSVHDKTSSPIKSSKGTFWCRVLKGYSDNLIVSLNEYGGGSFTTFRGKNTKTTLFRIIE